jgi:hypothetical protein
MVITVSSLIQVINVMLDIICQERLTFSQQEDIVRLQDIVVVAGLVMEISGLA